MFRRIQVISYPLIGDSTCYTKAAREYEGVHDAPFALKGNYLIGSYVIDGLIEFFFDSLHYKRPESVTDMCLCGDHILYHLHYRRFLPVRIPEAHVVRESI